MVLESSMLPKHCERDEQIPVTYMIRYLRECFRDSISQYDSSCIIKEGVTIDYKKAVILW